MNSGFVTGFQYTLRFFGKKIQNDPVGPEGGVVFQRNPRISR